jgi:CRP/FNR family cyclic AMP-dependent transcriptional regulator
MAYQPLEDINAGATAALLGNAYRRVVSRNSRLFNEGDRSDDAYLIVSGLIKMVKTAADGSETILAIRGAGDVVGELGAMDARPRLVTAIAATESLVARIRSEQLIEVMRTHPDVTFTMLANLTDQLRSAALQILALRSGDATALVARRLFLLASDPAFESLRSKDGGTIVIDMPVSQQELAGWAGVSHRSAVAVLQLLRDDGTITTSRLELRVIDLDALHACARATVAMEPR